MRVEYLKGMAKNLLNTRNPKKWQKHRENLRKSFTHRIYQRICFCIVSVDAVPLEASAGGISVAEVEALVLSVAGEVTGHSVDAQDLNFTSQIQQVLTRWWFLFFFFNFHPYLGR